MPSAREPIELLARGTVAVRGRMPWASNATFLTEIELDGHRTLAIYKPERGERPLWDFPSGLYKREVAAYQLSEALGWGLVPLTICRDDGPYGLGSLQLFVNADFEQNYFTMRDDPAYRDRLARICLFDILANNADRKGGHCLLGEDGLVYAIDNGLTFHTDLKLRTVIWEFGGEAIPGALLQDVRRLVAAPMPAGLAALIDRDETTALLRRARAVLKARRFPEDTTGYRYPWPLV